MSASRNYSRSGGFKEGRTSFRPVEVAGQHGGRSAETLKHEANYRSRRLEQTTMRDPSPEPDAPLLGSPEKEEVASETPAAVPDITPPAPDRPIEKKSYSRARRTRTKVGDAVKAAEELPPPSEGLTSAATVPETTPAAKTGNWEAPVDSTTGGLEQDVAQLSIAEQSWSPGQPSFLQPRELRGRHSRLETRSYYVTGTYLSGMQCVQVAPYTLAGQTGYMHMVCLLVFRAVCVIPKPVWLLMSVLSSLVWVNFLFSAQKK